MSLTSQKIIHAFFDDCHTDQKNILCFSLYPFIVFSCHLLQRCYLENILYWSFGKGLQLISKSRHHFPSEAIVVYSVNGVCNNVVHFMKKLLDSILFYVLTFLESLFSFKSSVVAKELFFIYRKVTDNFSYKNLPLFKWQNIILENFLPLWVLYES